MIISITRARGTLLLIVFTTSVGVVRINKISYKNSVKLIVQSNPGHTINSI